MCRYRIASSLPYLSKVHNYRREFPGVVHFFFLLLRSLILIPLMLDAPDHTIPYRRFIPNPTFYSSHTLEAINSNLPYLFYGLKLEHKNSSQRFQSERREWRDSNKALKAAAGVSVSISSGCPIVPSDLLTY